MMKKFNKKAFTLIEVIVVIAVIGILVLLGIPRFMGHTQKAELTRIQHDVKLMEREMGAEFVNGDDFDNWGNNIKNLNQLVQGDELFEKEGVAEEVESIGETYKVIPGEYRDKINTKLKGTFYANSHGKVYYEHGDGLEYSDEELDDLIKQHDFIPVATAEELNNVRSATLETYGEGTKWKDKYTGGLDKQYIQVKDIDLSEYGDWNPIGTESAKFTGSFDGGNYVVTDLEVNGEGNDYQGLFGYTEGATISNVGLIDNKVTGTSKVGGLVGRANASTIENSYTTGSVEGSASFSQVGGLVGYTSSSTVINNSYATGSVEGNNEVGGLVGYASSSTIENSYATGSVEGSRQIGGLVGWTRYNNKISNSYATGSVIATESGQFSNAGGLVGEATTGNTIENSYATGEVKSAGERVGGLVGYAQDNNTISNSYATGPVTGTSTVGGLVGWIHNNSGYSYIQYSAIINSYSKGTVTGTGSYNVGGLVGRAGTDVTISNSYATGLVTGRDNVGGLVGLTSSTIENSYFTGSVTGNYQVGGLVGRTGSSSISNSYSTGSVTGWLVGGLVGEAQTDVTISNSYASGPVTGGGNVGGLVGKDSDSEISNSYWDKETTGKSVSAGVGATGIATNEMKQQTTYEGWDFTNVWEITTGNYPTLR